MCVCVCVTYHEFFWWSGHTHLHTCTQLTFLFLYKVVQWLKQLTSGFFCIYFFISPLKKKNWYSLLNFYLCTHDTHLHKPKSIKYKFLPYRTTKNTWKGCRYRVYFAKVQIKKKKGKRWMSLVLVLFPVTCPHFQKKRYSTKQKKIHTFSFSFFAFLYCKILCKSKFKKYLVWVKWRTLDCQNIYLLTSGILVFW